MAVGPTSSCPEPAGPQEPGSPLEAGQIFHGLQIVGLVALGGMGVVYRARKPGTDRDVALKILPPALAAEEEFRLRFDREARALAGLSHPNIVRLHDYGVEGKLMFLVMEFVEGVSLRQHLREGTLSPARALAVCLELCQALEFAHAERVIHRDVKPDNVLIDETGRIKLTDFGLAIRIDAESARVTQTNYAVGTPHYMAPEQLERPDEIDLRVDIYSLGVVLYEMLTRELPIGRFPLPSSRASVGPALDEIICRCLEKDPGARFQTVADLRAALQGIAGSPRLREPSVPPPRPRITSNLEIRCACGCQFFVPAGAVAGVHCPSCGERVSFASRIPVPRSTPPTSSPPASTSPLLKLGIAASILLLLAGGLAVLALSSAPARRPLADSSIAYHPAELPVPPPPAVPAKAPAPPAAPPAAAPPAPPTRPPPAELRSRLQSLSGEANMTGVVATILLNSGRPQDHEELQQRLAAIDRDIREALRDLEAQGLGIDTPDRFQSGDRLLSFAGRRMEPARTLAFAEDLRDWLRTFHPGASGQVIVSRKKQMVSFAVTFPDRTPELVAIAHLAGVTLGESPGDPGSPRDLRPAVPAPIPASVLDPLRARVAALPPGYRDLMPSADRGRADVLLLAGKATGDDAAFLTGRFSDLLRRGEEEQKQIQVRIRELEARIADSALQADVIVCKDGRRIEGILLEESETQVKVKARFGAVTFRRDEITRIDKGKGAAGEFRAGYDAARGRKADLLRLLAIAKERKLVPQQELAALGVLALDPTDEQVRADGGLPRNPYRGTAEPDPVLGSGRIDYLGRVFTPDQFRQELRSLGYVLLNGVWCEKVSKSIKIDSLYRDEARLAAILQGASIQSQTHTEHDSVYDFQTKSWVPRTKKVADGRYIGGGICFIEITVPGDLIEARVHARSQVAKVGGFVTVSVVLDPGEQAGKVLFSLSAPGENDGSYDATEKVAGHRRFYVRAQIGGTGMFLISDSNDLGVFEVKCVYGRPLDRINALLAGATVGVETILTTDFKSNNDSVESSCRTVAAAASRLETLVDSLAEIRRRTETLLYARDYILPERFTDLGAQLKDPLEPDWNGMTREQALSLGTWWGRLPADDRRDFLTAYGLWCARCRYLRNPR